MIFLKGLHTGMQKCMGHGFFIPFFVHVISHLRISIGRIFQKLLFRIALSVFTLILLLAILFFCRRPVILVSDRAFDILYGQGRSQCKRISLSLNLFRPIKVISIAEGAGPDLVVRGVMSLSRQPLAVFFPFRYKEAARHYLDKMPGSRAVILAGRKLPEYGYEAEASQGSTAIPLWINTDTVTDLYRAGIIAGIFTQYDNLVPWQGIALVHEGLGEEEKSAFVRGLEAQQWAGTPVFLSDLTVKDLSCAVVLKDFHFYGEESARSLIFFTWLDPALASDKTRAIFDDSPWAQIGPVLKNIRKGKQDGLIPSEIILNRGDKEHNDVYNEINRIKILKLKAENADN